MEGGKGGCGQISVTRMMACFLLLSIVWDQADGDLTPSILSMPQLFIIEQIIEGLAFLGNQYSVW